MFQFLHNGCFSQEIIKCHRILFESFHCDSSVESLPESFINVPVLSTSKFVLHHNIRSINFPLIGVRTRESSARKERRTSALATNGRSCPLRGWIEKLRNEPVRMD